VISRADGSAQSLLKQARTTLRRLAFGLATLAGVRRGFFIPYRYAHRLPAPTYRALGDLLAAREDRFAAMLDGLGRYATALTAIGEEPPPAPRWRQDWFPRLDAAVAYALVRERRPARIVEVGSGHSTRFLARAVIDGGLSTEITAVDPAPRAVLRGLPVTWLATTATEPAPSPFRALGPGDMLFIDSSHILMPGSDVDFLLNEVIPVLPAGVAVHFHDIFLPDDYPQAWSWRGYNEQLAVGPLLAGGWDVLFASHYVATRLGARVATSIAAQLPLPPGAFESSLWLERPSR
jgi:Methyltransferase domain